MRKLMIVALLATASACGGEAMVNCHYEDGESSWAIRVWAERQENESLDAYALRAHGAVDAMVTVLRNHEAYKASHP